MAALIFWSHSQAQSETPPTVPIVNAKQARKKVQPLIDSEEEKEVPKRAQPRKIQDKELEKEAEEEPKPAYDCTLDSKCTDCDPVTKICSKFMPKHFDFASSDGKRLPKSTENKTEEEQGDK